jgi:hypothetical protein
VRQPGESYWLPEDREKALAWARDQRTRCPNCKQIPSDGLDENRVPLVPLPMRAETHRCQFCVAIERERALLDKRAKEDPQQRWGTFQVLVTTTNGQVREG